jgi:hypothetical protein
MRALALAIALSLCTLSSPRAEEPTPAPAPLPGLDGSKPLRCALAKATECDADAACGAVALEQIEMPDQVDLDFAAKQLVSTTDAQRTSPIHAIETLERVLVLQGHQNGRGWTIVIERATGHLAATLADIEGSFVLAGGCSPR